MSVAYSTQYYALFLFTQLMRALPRPLALFIGGCIGQLGWLIRIKRSLVLSNLRQALPHVSEKELRRIGARSARNFSRTITEFVRFDGGDRHFIDDLITLTGAESIEAAMKKGKGCIVITGHLGAWALYFSALSRRGIPISLLVGKQHNPKVDTFIHRITGPEISFISKGRSAIKKILLSLEAGRCIVMVADQHAGPHGTLSPFLGRKASTLTLPGAFVARNKVPVFTMFGHREAGGRHKIEVAPLAFPACSSDEELKQAVADRLNHAIGEAALKRPDQYFWYHRRWRDADQERETELGQSVPAPSNPQASSPS